MPYPRVSAIEQQDIDRLSPECFLRMQEPAPAACTHTTNHQRSHVGNHFRKITLEALKLRLICRAVQGHQVAGGVNLIPSLNYNQRSYQITADLSVAD